MGDRIALRVRLGLCLSMALLLVACVSTSPLAETKPPPAESGVVVLKVVSDGSQTDEDMVRLVVSARLRRDAAWTTSGSSRVRLTRAQVATNSGVMLGGVVEPGLYSLVSLETIQRNHSFDDNALRFEVKPGATTLLGTLIFHGQSRQPKLLPADAGSLEPIEQSFPALFGAKVAKRELVLQVSSSLPDARLAAHELKKNAQIADDWGQLDNGDFAAPGRLGTIAYRKQGSSRREVIDIGDWRDVLSVRSFQGGLLVAGEEGLFRFSPDGGATWRSLAPPTRGMIRSVHPTGQEAATAIVRTGARWTVHVTPDVFTGGWRQVAEFVFEGLPHPDAQPLPLAASLPNGFGLIQMRWDYRFVAVSGRVHESRTFPADSIRATSDGLLILEKWRTVGALMSVDEGKTWNDVKLPYSSLLVAFQDRRTFFAIAALPGGTLPQQYATYVTRDGGANWSRSGVSPVGPGQALRFWASPAGALQVELADGAVLQSTDGGLSWARLPS